MTAIRLIDDTGRLLRAPEVTFQANEIGHDAFGYNVPTAELAIALERAAEGRLTRIRQRRHRAHRTRPGRRQPSRREKASTTQARWSQQPTAAIRCAGRPLRHLNARVGLSAGGGRHHFHAFRGPTTRLDRVASPRRSADRRALARANVRASCGSTRRQEAERLAALADHAFKDELSRHVSRLLGTHRRVSAPRACSRSQVRPPKLRAQPHRTRSARRGMSFLPIGAQGLNLSLRDAATLRRACRRRAGPHRRSRRARTPGRLRTARRRLDVARASGRSTC